MKTANYPALGSRVAYVRQGIGAGIIEGTGIVMGIVLDPAKRPMVHLETDELNEDGKQVRRNVHLTCLNPSDDFKLAFKAALDAVAALAEEGNSKSSAIVAEYNQRVDEANAPVLGVPVEFE